MIFKKVILCFVSCISVLMVMAQQWTVYNTANSPLPDNQIHAIAIQKFGIKWIGTINGLARFDGHAWVIYNPANSGLPSSNITAIALGRSNSIWVGTDKGLAQYDGAEWKLYNTQNSLLTRNTISKLYWDPNTETLWVATELGLVTYDGTNWVNMENANPFFAEELVCSIETDKVGNVWIGTFDHFQFQGRLWQYNGINWKRHKLEDHDLSSSFPSAVVADESNRIWLTTKGTMGGFLVEINNGNWHIVNQLSLNCFQGGINAFLLQGNKKWLATGAGLVMYNEVNCSNFTSRNSGLSDDYLSCIALDSNGYKWIGTINGGIVVYKEKLQTENPVTTSLNIFPNPVKTIATITFELSAATHVSILLFNASGQLIETLYNQNIPAGKHSFTCNFLGHARGVYYCTLFYNKTKMISKSIFFRY